MTRFILVIVLLAQAVAMGILYAKSRDADDASARSESRLSALRDRLEQCTQESRSAVAEMEIRISSIDELLHQLSVQIAEAAAQQKAAAQKAIDNQRSAAIGAITGSIHSLSAATETRVKFINGDKDRNYDVYWIDYGGKPVRYKSLVPGEEYEQSTYVSHPWAFVDNTGNVLKRLYVPTGVEHQTVVLRGADFQLSVQTLPSVPRVNLPSASANGF